MLPFGQVLFYISMKDLDIYFISVYTTVISISMQCDNASHLLFSLFACPSPGVAGSLSSCVQKACYLVALRPSS